jgi:tetratricopeptide (TPR) repeat protein
MRYLRYILVFALMVLGLAKVGAQNDRNFIRQGNRAYHKQKWAAAETQYRKAISKNQKNAQAVYNLGCALMMQQKDSMAMIQFENASKLETNKMRRARSYHNMGVVMQQHQQYAQAIGCYENALRCNPQDNATRYNLALCKKLLKNQKQNNKNKNNKNKNKDKNKDKQNKDQNKDKNKNDKNKNNQQNQNNQDKMSKDNAEQLLNAAIQQEKDTKRKMQKAMSQPRRKQYEKNW